MPGLSPNPSPLSEPERAAWALILEAEGWALGRVADSRIVWARNLLTRALDQADIPWPKIELALELLRFRV